MTEASKTNPYVQFSVFSNDRLRLICLNEDPRMDQLKEILFKRRFFTDVMRVQLNNTKQNLYIWAKRASLKNYSCFETVFWEDFTR